MITFNNKICLSSLIIISEIIIPRFYYTVTIKVQRENWIKQLSFVCLHKLKNTSFPNMINRLIQKEINWIPTEHLSHV